MYYPMRVLFLCTHNDIRSPMAEGFLRHFGAPDFDVNSGGAQPTSIHPIAQTVMSERGIDLSHATAKDMMQFHGTDFDYTITLCDRDRNEDCPVLPDEPDRIFWTFPDPLLAGDEEAQLKLARRVATELRERIQYFVLAQRRRMRDEGFISAPPEVMM